MTLNRENERGVAMVELALVFPVLALVVFMGIEFSRALQRIEMASALSREAASIAYREAVANPAGDPTLTYTSPAKKDPITNQLFDAEMQHIVENSAELDSLRQLARTLVPCTEVRITVARNTFASGTTPAAWRMWQSLLSTPPATANCPGSFPNRYANTVLFDNTNGNLWFTGYDRSVSPPAAVAGEPTLRLLPDPTVVNPIGSSPTAPHYTYLALGEAHIAFTSLAYVPWLTTALPDYPEFYDATVLFQ